MSFQSFTRKGHLCPSSPIRIKNLKHLCVHPGITKKSHPWTGYTLKLLHVSFHSSPCPSQHGPTNPPWASIMSDLDPHGLTLATHNYSMIMILKHSFFLMVNSLEKCLKRNLRVSHLFDWTSHTTCCLFMYNFLSFIIWLSMFFFHCLIWFSNFGIL